MASHQFTHVLLLLVSLLLFSSVSNGLKITYPPSLAGAVASLRGSFSGVLPPYTSPITSDLVLANPCSPITTDVSGKIVFSSVDAGVCLYYNQTMNVANAGGIGLILSKTSTTYVVLPMLYTASKASTPIPCVSIDGVNAAKIRTQLTQNNTVTVQLGYTPAIAAETTALLDFWTSLSGPTWTFGATGLYNAWSTTTDPCSAWYGVVCDDTTGAVVGISLPLNGLKGNVPSSISQLTSMAQIQLSANAITGFPDAVFQFPNMFSIEASGDAIATSIPSNVGIMTKMITLNLGTNDMTGSLPDSLSQLTNLQTVQLNGNAFTGTIPTNIGNLAQCTYLTLSQNSMNGTIPSSIGGMTALTRLELASNGFGGALPDSIASLTNLGFLDISSNTFSGSMPSQIIALTKLTYLNVAGNSLTGTLPSLSSATHMQVMDISNNQFTGPLNGKAFSSVITSIKAAHNQFTSIINFSGLSALLSVDISYNNLQLFTDIQNLPKTTTTQINQGISGLTSIDLSHNQLRNVTLLFDMSLENWPSLTSMNLAYNKLGGVLAPPAQASASQYLKTIDLSNNFIEGSVPDIYGDLPSLTTFDIRNNSVYHGTGTLVPSFAIADYSTLYDWPAGNAYCPSFDNGQLTFYVDNSYHDYLLCQCKTSYRRAPNVVPLDCAVCPDHLICDNTRANDSTFVFEAGWYPTPTVEDPIEMIECPNCMTSDNTEFECQGGYSGRLCGKCVHGYYLRGNKCEVCHPSGVILFVVVIVIIVAIIIYFSVLFSRTSEKMLQSVSSMEFVSNRVEVGTAPATPPLTASTTAVVAPTNNSPTPTMRNSSAFLTAKEPKPKKQITILRYIKFEPSLAIVTIIINYTQTLSILCRYFSLDYSLKQVLGITSIANVSGTGFGIECIQQALGGTHARYLFNSLQPIAVSVAAGIAALLGILLFRVILKQSFRWWLIVCGRTWFFLLDFLFFPVLIDCISVFRCEDDPATHISYMSDFPYSTCNAVPLGQKAGLLVLNLVGIYGLFITLLVLYRRTSGTRRAHIYTMFGFFFTQYKHEYFYAGIFYLTRRLIFSILNGLLATVSLQLFISNMIFIIFSIMLVYTIRPFKRSIDNYYEVASYVSLAFCYSILFVGSYTGTGITKAFFWVFINVLLYLGFLVVLAASKIPTWAEVRAFILCEWARAKVERYDEGEE